MTAAVWRDEPNPVFQSEQEAKGDAAGHVHVGLHVYVYILTSHFNIVPRPLHDLVDSVSIVVR